MLIPNRFQLLGQTFEVEMDENLKRDYQAVGMAEYSKGLIRLQPSTDWSERSESFIGQTFCHELMHCLLFAISEDDMAADEKLVDRLGAVLHQALCTFEYDEEEECGCEDE